MTTSRAPKKSVAKSAAHETSSLEFISQMLATGLASSFESLKDKVSVNFKDNGEQYLTDALDKLKKAAADLADWGKKNPVKTTVAVAAVLAVTAFLVSTAKNHAAKENDENESSSAKGSKPAIKAKSSSRS